MAYLTQVDVAVSITHEMWDAAGTTRVSGEAANIVTGLTDPEGEASAIEVTVTEVGTSGLYTVSFSPDELGNWIVTATNPAGTDEAVSSYTVVTMSGVAGLPRQHLTTVARVKRRIDTEGALGSTYDDLILEMIGEASADIHARLGRIIPEDTYTEYRDGHGLDTMILRQGPLVSITSIHEVEYSDSGDGSQAETGTEVEAFNYVGGGLLTEGHSGPGTIRLLSSTYTTGIRNYAIIYVAGYSLIPEALARAATNYVAAMFFTREVAGLMNKSIGDSEISPIPMKNLDEAVARSIAPYRFEGVA